MPPMERRSANRGKISAARERTRRNWLLAEAEPVVNPEVSLEK